ncbi:hypothetical protein BGZ83_010381 [Gryganskiella cystojenkinii]|nr:hypothetical protein BGZ83_010381 [Gryganskiella cystojenkinii]
MATKTDASRHQSPSQSYRPYPPSQQQQQQNQLSQRTPQKTQEQPKQYATYTLYPDLPRRKTSNGTITAAGSTAAAQSSSTHPSSSVQQQRPQQQQLQLQSTSQTRSAMLPPQTQGSNRSNYHPTLNQGGSSTVGTLPSSSSSPSKANTSSAAQGLTRGASGGGPVESGKNNSNQATSPLSPPISQGYVLLTKTTARTGEVTRDTKTYQSTQQQQPQQQRKYPTLQEQPIYGGSVPRASLQGPTSPSSSQPTPSLLPYRQQQQQPSSGSSMSPRNNNNNGNNSQHSYATLQPTSPTTSSQSGQTHTLSRSRSTSNNNDRPSLITAIPSSSLFLSFDEYYRDAPITPNGSNNSGSSTSPQDQENLRQQALLYQQKLKQRPPTKNGKGEDTDEDDSDTGSVISYRRSIHRLSMTYKGRAGVPNISLFAPNQKPKIVEGSLLSSIQKSGSNSKDQYQQSSGGLSMATIDHRSDRSIHTQQQQPPNQYYQHQQLQQPQQQQHSVRTRMTRANTGDGSSSSAAAYAAAQRGHRDIRIPERSISADDIYSPSSSSSRPTGHHQQEQQHYGTNLSSTSAGGPILRQGSAPAMVTSSTTYHQNQGHHNRNQGAHSNIAVNQPRPSQESAQSRNYNSGNNSAVNLPRPSQESSQSQFRSRSEGVDRKGGRSLAVTTIATVSGSSSAAYGRSKSSDRARDMSGGSYSQVPSRNMTAPAVPGARGGIFGNNLNSSNTHLNMHPAHHLPSGGYVRPEEAVGPSNPMPEKAEDYVRQGIDYHELGEIAKATQYFRTAAELGDPVGMLMYGLSVRHGWGCAPNRVLAFQYLQKSAEHAVGDLKSRDSFVNKAAKGELILAIYELGICFRHGWGVQKDKKTAAYYFEIAANLGDPDAQNDLAWCYYHGIGVKKDMYKSAKYYRLAAAQGQELMGNSWIWKDKYGGPTSPGAQDSSSTRSTNSAAALKSMSSLKFSSPTSPTTVSAPSTPGHSTMSPSRPNHQTLHAY